MPDETEKGQNQPAKKEDQVKDLRDKQLDANDAQNVRGGLASKLNDKV